MFVLLVFGGALSHPVEAVGQEGRRLKIVSPEMDSLAINDRLGNESSIETLMIN